ncbi:DNA repair protein [Ceraceosorus guamensis]|uniref:DNA repair protein RAD14 n=1 Tax=Ceraceosorus guamensis TaxID=1522189 RepID=A0A316WAQ2_9BASI|nr:DNA repair protein [Ceraceosorus guamensis]PWN45801.1 DNA repair protein [Ceraceosorus guamensis]
MAPATPPRDLEAGPSGTPDHVRIMQENRLKAKARLQSLAAAQNPTTLNGNGKRPQGPLSLESGRSSYSGPTVGPNANLSSSIPSNSRNANLGSEATKVSPTKRGQLAQAGQPRDDSNAPLPRDKSLGNYIEYDLSRLHNSKGGFLVEEGDEYSKTAEELAREKERERERIKADMEPGMMLDPSRQEACQECQSLEIDDQLRRVFGVRVCRSCSKRLPEKYSLLTKTEVKEDYLLTDAELKDTELLPHLLKKNPHKASYSNMMLFLRCQVEAYAFSAAKWGSEEGLDNEFQRREDEKARKRGKKFAQGLKELRRRTMNDTFRKRQETGNHTHEWQDLGDGTQQCDCGATIDVEVF